MKLPSYFIPFLVLVVALFAFPRAAKASSIQALSNIQINTLPGKKQYHKPNLNESDGFDEANHKRRQQAQKEKKSKEAMTSKPVVKHNL